jgi:16S rRNA (adenine1518-N6/adenine1519-N6)-dimethyltransferase
MGALTTVMAKQAGRILAVELDATLVEKLGAILASASNVHVIQGDILAINLDEQMARIVPAPAAASYKVVANLPYYITTPILRYFFDQRQRPSLIVVTVQAEVARRMVAAPPDMNFLAVLVQFYGAAQIMRLISPGAFYPPPKVGSAVMRITLHDQLPLDANRTQQFFRLVSAGFSQPRKQLHNPLMQGTGRGRAEIIAALRSCGLDEKQRAETLTVQDWLRLLLFLFPS